MATLEVKVYMAPHTTITAGYTKLRYFFGNVSVDSAGTNTRDLQEIQGRVQFKKLKNLISSHVSMVVHHFQ